MGHDDNIVDRHFIRLAQQKDMTLPQVKAWVLDMLENNAILDDQVKEMFDRAAIAWGQSVAEAKKNTKKLLQERLYH